MALSPTSSRSSSSGGSGATVIQTVNGDGSSPNLDFTAIPATYTHLQLLVLGRSNTAATSDVTSLIVNSDTTAAHYDWSTLRGVNTTATSANGGTGDSKIDLVFVTANSAPANYAALLTIDLPFYKATTWFKVIKITNNEATAQSAAGVNVIHETGIWRSTVAITGLRLALGVGNWLTGTTGVLYGIG